MTSMRKKAGRICRALERFMGVPEHRWKGADPLEGLVKTILSQNNTAASTDKAFQSLKKRFSRTGRRGIDWPALASARTSSIAAAIRSGGLANQKSERIRNIVRWVREEFGDYSIDPVCSMESSRAIAFFTTQKGIGLKTISCVLLFCCGTDVFPVDTHVNRVCRRLGLVAGSGGADETFRAMRGLVPRGKSYSLHVNMVNFGRRVCRARNPRCPECPLRKECRFFRDLKRGKGRAQSR